MTDPLAQSDSAGSEGFKTRLRLRMDRAFHMARAVPRSFARRLRRDPESSREPQPELFGLDAALAAPEPPEVTDVYSLPSTDVRQQASRPHCCVFAMAAAMETRLMAQGGAECEIVTAALWNHQPTQDLHAAARAARAGGPDTVGNSHRAVCEDITTYPDSQTQRRMVAALEAGVPLAIRMVPWTNFRPRTWQGVVYDARGQEDGSHAVCVVGYGTARGGRNYWIAKNSYGPAWNIDGFVRIAWGDPYVYPERLVYAIREVL